MQEIQVPQAYDELTDTFSEYETEFTLGKKLGQGK
jgi:hypothetical protein